MINILAREFYLFGIFISPQDFYILGLLMISGVVGVALFTAAYGRLFCGWVCPQTVFMEMVFRKIEYLLEGDAPQQRRLAAEPWSKKEKLLKSGSKHLLFILISFLTINTFMAYLVGREKFWNMALASPLDHPLPFLAVLFFTFLFYMVFARLREQVCIAACPYGRLQGVLLDKNSIVVAYDFRRGEPRGKLKAKEKDPAQGDCIDCKQCVAVCPTGIDIRNGTQLECINCTACIDACDEIMEKIHRPKGLIKYASYNQIAEGKPFRFTKRILAYTTVLLVLISVVSYSLISRSPLQGSVNRARGALYQTQPDGRITNLYTYQFINKTQSPQTYQLVLVEPKGQITVIGKKSSAITLAPHQELSGALLITAEKGDLRGLNTPVVLEIKQGNEVVKSFKSSFLGPSQ
jgi:cytochrome c oxidase accessory protein FixG